MKALRPRPQTVLPVLCLCLLLSSETESCGPGRGSGRRRRPRKLTPLVFKQHVPNVSENTLGASGIAEKPIKRSDPKFKDLVRNDNPDIKFKDEEGTGADRIMTQRCKDKLNTLAISVMNQWPGVKLRVTEAWDEDHLHAEDSLHYEGRAVDITTSDRDKAKYGMLARLAVEAGFDWVYYESRGHIHCSVKSDSSVAIKIGGCFSGTSDVITSGGVTKAMSDVTLGERVLGMDEEGRLVYTEVIAFLDRDGEQRGYFYTLTTDRGHSVTLTAKHLIYVTDSNVTSADHDVWARGEKKSLDGGGFAVDRLHTLFAEEVQVGHVIMVVEDDGRPISGTSTSTSTTSASSSSSSSFGGGARDTFARMRPARVTHVQAGGREGVYAPLTATGTIVVDGALASCYAVINNPTLAHAVFAPMRGWHELSARLPSWLSPLSSLNTQVDSLPQKGVHLYAKLLYELGSLLLSRNVLYVP